MDKTLMIIGAGIEQVPGIKLAKAMGLKVIVTDKNPTAPGFKYANEHFIVSTYDIKGNVAAAKRYNKKNKIDGVMAFGCDIPLVVATVAKELGVWGISMEAAKLASDKLEMKERFQQDNIPIPWFTEISDLRHFKEVIKKSRLPIVIKPVDSRGARGVLRITKNVDLKWAFNTTVSHSITKRVMVEEFLFGPQISTESIVYDGKIFTPGLSNRNYEYLERLSPYIIENGGDLPVKLNETQKEELNLILKKSAKSLGIKTGVLKGDIVWTKEGPKIIEVAARLSGGWFSTHQIPLSTGVNIVKSAIEISLGLKLDFDELIPKYQRGVALRYLFPFPGVVRRVSGEGEVKKKKWVKEIQIYVKPGDIVEEITDHTKRTGFVICVGGTRQEAVKRAKEAIKRIKIGTESR